MASRKNLFHNSLAVMFTLWLGWPAKASMALRYTSRLAGRPSHEYDEEEEDPLALASVTHT